MASLKRVPRIDRHSRFLQLGFLLTQAICCQTAWERGPAPANPTGEERSTGEGLRVISPFPFEPLEFSEFHLKVLVAERLRPCDVMITVNGYVLGQIKDSDLTQSEGGWKPNSTEGFRLGRFNRLTLITLPSHCSSGDGQQCSKKDVTAKSVVDFEIVNFTRFLYSGACEPTPNGTDFQNPPKSEMLSAILGEKSSTPAILARLAPLVSQLLNEHQNREPRLCESARFVLWNSFGAHGFGSQLSSLRMGLEYGMRTNRVVVQNAAFEVSIVEEDLQLRCVCSLSLRFFLKAAFHLPPGAYATFSTAMASQDANSTTLQARIKDCVYFDDVRDSAG